MPGSCCRCCRSICRHDHVFTLLLFWETIGGLLKQGLLSEELAFDTVLDAPPGRSSSASYAIYASSATSPEKARTSSTPTSAR
jgi:hypothetical protein